MILYSLCSCLRSSWLCAHPGEAADDVRRRSGWNHPRLVRLHSQGAEGADELPQGGGFWQNKGRLPQCSGDLSAPADVAHRRYPLIDNPIDLESGPVACTPTHPLLARPLAHPHFTRRSRQSSSLDIRLLIHLLFLPDTGRRWSQILFLWHR